MICNECETVSYCTKHGCIPKQPAQPVVQEPIGYVKLIDTPFGEKLKPVLTIAVPVGSKLYTAPPAARQWVGLTDEKKRQIFEREDYQGWLDYINTIEAELKEKNT
jgi:hypothetical protein